MFVRLFRPSERKEVLVNVNLVSKIEIEYAVPGQDGNYWKTTLDDGIENPDAVRFYRVHVAGDVFVLASAPNDPVMIIFEEIYKKAIKG